MDIDKEIYVAVTQDRVRQRDVLIVSTQGGMDIEEVAHNNPADIARLYIDPLLGLPDYACRQVLFDAKFDKALKVEVRRRPSRWSPRVSSCWRACRRGGRPLRRPRAAR